ALVQKGQAHGLLAFAEEQPVGWLALGRRRDFAKLDRAPSLQCSDADRVWSLPCFFIHKDWRSKRVATALLKAAVQQLEQRGAEIIEGYPVKADKPLPAAFAYTGTVPLFQRAGFQIVAARPAGKQRMRRPGSRSS